MISRASMTIGSVFISAVLVSSCGTTEEENTPVTVTQTVVADPTTSATSEQSATPTTESSQEIPSTNSAVQPTTNDRVFAAIDKILADEPDGVVVYIDRWDAHGTSNPGYDIDVVVGSHVLKREVEFKPKTTQTNSAGPTSEIQNQALISDDQGVARNSFSTSTAVELAFANAQYSAQGDSGVGMMDGREVIPRRQHEYGSDPMDNPNQAPIVPREESEGYKKHNPRAQLDDHAQAVANSVQASVTAADAIEQALDQYPGGILQQAQLEQGDQGVQWAIQLSTDNRRPLVELKLPAR